VSEENATGFVQLYRSLGEAGIHKRKFKQQKFKPLKSFKVFKSSEHSLAKRVSI